MLHTLSLLIFKAVVSLQNPNYSSLRKTPRYVWLPIRLLFQVVRRAFIVILHVHVLVQKQF